MQQKGNRNVKENHQKIFKMEQKGYNALTKHKAKINKK